MSRMDNTTDANPRPSQHHNDPAPSQATVAQEQEHSQSQGQDHGRSKSHERSQREPHVYDMSQDQNHPSHLNPTKTQSRDHRPGRVHRSGSTNSVGNSSSFSSINDSYDRLNVEVDGLTHHHRLATQELDDQSGNGSILNSNSFHHNSQTYSQSYSSRRQPDSEDDPPPHVHSQACQDSCPVQDIYTEINYSRFGRGARTNLYGLVVVKEIGKPPQPAQAQAESFTSSTPSPIPSFPLTETLTGSGPEGNTQSLGNAYSGTTSNSPAHSKNSVPSTSSTPTLPAQNGIQEDANVTRKKQSIFSTSGATRYHHLPGRYALVAAGNSIKCFMGLQESFEFSVGKMSSLIVPTSEEIVSMDAFERKDERGCQLIVVVSIAKADDTDQFELRIYGVNTFASSIRELLLGLPATTDVQCIPISWAPTKIIHAPLEDDPFEMAILVGGSDSCVHFFVQSPGGVGPYEEHPVGTHFSVLASFSYCEYCVLSLVVQDYVDCRIVAAGTQNGTLNVGIIPRNPETFQLDRDNAKSHTVVLFAPITTLSVFTSRVSTEQRWKRRKQAIDEKQKEGSQETKDKVMEDILDLKLEPAEDSRDEGIHLLVTCATEQAWIYSDIVGCALTKRTDLAECSYHDSIMASHVMDADWDGRNEVLIGTYGRQLMVFKELATGQGPYGEGSVMAANAASLSSLSLPQVPHRLLQPQSQHLHLHHSSQLHPNHHHHHSQQQHQHHAYSRPASVSQYQHLYHPPHSNSPLSISPSSVPSSSMAAVPPLAPPLQYGMTWNRRFATPVYGVSSADLNDDGLEELIVTTVNGVSIFLPDPITAKRRLVRAVERMKEIEQMRRLVEQLRSENQALVEQKRLKEERAKQEELKKQRKKKEEEEEEQRRVQEALEKQQQQQQQQQDEKEKEETKEGQESVSECLQKETLAEEHEEESSIQDQDDVVATKSLPRLDEEEEEEEEEEQEKVKALAGSVDAEPKSEGESEQEPLTIEQEQEQKSEEHDKEGSSHVDLSESGPDDPAAEADPTSDTNNISTVEKELDNTTD